MSVKSIDIESFLILGEEHPILDVRSPGEYLQAHIPIAYSFPLFNDQERAEIGTLYKQRSRSEAILKGVDYFGPSMRVMIEKAGQILEAHSLQRKRKQTTTNTLLVHCWRGGMRSAAVAWLLDLYGYEIYTLKGGYKAYRNWVIREYSKPWAFKVVGGYTGSGKTEVLQAINKYTKQPIVDLEGLAHHKGSAFGAIEQPAQPSQEQFENLLSATLFRIRRKQAIGSAFDSTGDECSGPVWIEDESLRIGTVNIPQPMWQHMRKQPVYFLEIPFEKRLAYLVRTYGKLDRSLLVAAITRLQKRLGGLETKTAVNYLLEGNTSDCFAILLKYYDKQYRKSLENREEKIDILTLSQEEVQPTEIALSLVRKFGNYEQTGTNQAD